jgi:hypothetical protein
MNSFSSTCAGATTAPPDPRKHVNYVQGMVLGADDLNQEFVYHRHQTHWLARDAIGYGTLSGLSVAVGPSSNGPEVSVTPGTALSPRSQLIRVAPKQCAALNSWLALAATQQQLAALGVGANGSVTAYVVLCFRDCQTDPLPIPGEPCRCDSNATAPSRITDDFRLELRLAPPAQPEEDAIRDFVQWLRSIKITAATSGYTSIEDFLQAIRNAAHGLTSPVESPPDFLEGLPPSNLVIPCGQLCDYLRAALRLWVTELRPLWQVQWATQAGGGCGCHGAVQTVGADGEECLLLAALTIRLTSGQVTDPTRVQVDDSARPFVVHLRMLQEWLLFGSCGARLCGEHTFATVFAVNPHTLRIWVHHPLTVHLTEAAVQLELDDEPVGGFSVAPVETATGPSAAVEPNVFDLDLGASPPTPLQEHQRFTIRFDTRLIIEDASPARSLAEAIDGGCWCYPDFADDLLSVFGTVELGGQSSAQPAKTPPAAEQFGSIASIGTSLTYARADHVHPMPPNPIPPHVANTSAHLGHVIKLDVQGTLGAASVVALQGVGFAGGPPSSPANDGNLLTFSNGKWQPAPGGSQFVEHPIPEPYLIVAAGLFKMTDGSSIGPIYNQLTAKRQGNGFVLSFGGTAGDARQRYVNPDPTGPNPKKFNYIVKGTVLAKVPTSTNFIVIGFQPDGILVQMGVNGSPEFFMVEISLFGTSFT